MASRRYNWTDAYATGFERIDTQHRLFLHWMNDLGGAIDSSIGEAALPATLDFLDAFVDVHFGDEEDTMYLHRCPVADQNKAEHRVFLAEFNTIKDLYERLGPSDDLARQLFRLMIDFFLRHVKRCDCVLRTCRNNRRPA